MEGGVAFAAVGDGTSIGIVLAAFEFWLNRSLLAETPLRQTANAPIPTKRKARRVSPAASGEPARSLVALVRSDESLMECSSRSNSDRPEAKKPARPPW